MAQPRDYTRQYNFNDFQTTNPDDPLPGPQIDSELNAVKLTLDDLNTNIGLVQRDDGKLRNSAVHKDAFSQDALAIINSDFTPRGDWSTATSYAVNDAVDFNGATYVATVAHTSSAAFSTDDAADRWILIANAAISGTGSAVDKFEGDGNTTSFTLTYTYTSETAVQVFVNGELLNPVDDYTISGNTLTLYTAPGLPSVAGNENVIVWGASVVAQAAAQDASGHESNASGFADEAEDWASQTTGIVESTDYSSKAYAIGGTGVDAGAGSAKDWATKTSGTVGNTSEYSSKYWATQGNVPIVAQNITDINTVAGISSNVTTVSGIQANVTTVAGISTDVSTVSGISTNVSTVAARDTDIGTLAAQSTDLSTLGAISTDISTVSGISANTTTVAGISSDVTTAAGISSNITTVAGISSNVTQVANDSSDIQAIATDITGTNTIGTAAGSIANVNIVANAITNVNSTAQNMSDINTVAGQISNNNLQTIATDIQAVITTANDLNEATSEIDTVANSITNVDLVGGSISNVNTVATNLTSVNAFFDTYFVSATVPASPTTGDLWFDTSTSSMKVYTGNSFVNAGSAVNGTADRYTYTATAGQTTFSGADDNNNTLAYDAGFTDVYMNGVKLMPGDITASNGTSIVLTGGGAAANDTLEIVAYGTFELANININSMTDVSTTGAENGSLFLYNSTNSQFETSGDYKTVYASTTHTATDLTFYLTSGSDIAELQFTHSGHGLSVGDYVRVDSSSVTTWLSAWTLFVTFDYTSIAQMVRVIDVYGDTFRVNITCTAVQSSSTSLGQNGTYYYDTGVATISAPDIDITTSSLDVSGELNVAKKATANEIDLNAISATIADTAVDIFVYDTRKDSDGGAWRKRTQHTSWYNETLNTGFRGSRREFPAVAVIVAESNQVTIYDGDDPDMPMWMVFNAGGSNPNTNGIGGSYANSGTCCAALNGIIFYGGNGGNYQNGQEINLIKEVIHRHSIETTGGIYRGNISERNSAKGWGGTQLPLVAYQVNDVAMTVMPNAPIDAATGLPVPTIAVATNSGISVIKDDGGVVSTASSSYVVGSIQILPTGEIYHSQGLSGNNGFCYNDNFERLSGLQNGTFANNSTFWYAIDNIGNDSSLLGGGLADENAVGEGLDTAVGTASGLTAIALNPSSYDDGMVAWRTSDYNTGWMNGDIKLATLSDTDDTNVTGAELVTNGTFDTDTSNWSAVGSNISVTGGTLQVVGTANFNYATQTVTGLTVGKKYVFQADIVTGSGNSYIYVRRGDNGGGITNGSANGVGSYALTFEAPTASVEIRLYQIYTTTTTFDNVSIRLAEEDRSVNGNGLQVFGTVTKSAVATGADLVAYSGFSSSNYLEQPYNSDLDFGTGDFCVMGWSYPTAIGTNARTFVSRYTPSGNTGWNVSYHTDGSLYFYTTSSGVPTYGTISGGTPVTTNVWQHLVFTRTDGVLKIYKNGALVETYTGTVRDVTDTSAVVRISNQGTLAHADPGKMALWRISATVPSPEQIKKIYEDEKFLFQDGAQATLYGSSDAVTALAYDDTTELLHVGTSAGRSVFQGLRRVDNTTDAVGAAISASNGLVAED